SEGDRRCHRSEAGSSKSSRFGGFLSRERWKTQGICVVLPRRGQRCEMARRSLQSSGGSEGDRRCHSSEAGSSKSSRFGGVLSQERWKTQGICVVLPRRGQRCEMARTSIQSSRSSEGDRRCHRSEAGSSNSSRFGGVLSRERWKTQG